MKQEAESKIEIKKQPPIGFCGVRYAFYVNGQRLGSASTKAAAMRAAKDVVAAITTAGKSEAET